MSQRRTKANRRFINLISFSLSLLLCPLALPVLLHPEAKVTESYSKTQATRNEGQNPCASKDAAADAAAAAAAAAVAAVAETREGTEGSREEGERKRRRDGEAGETKTPEEKRKSIEKRSGREREKE